VATTYDIETFYAGLVEHGLIIPTGLKGGYGRGAVFEDILNRFDDLVTRTAAADKAESVTFPPVLSRGLIEKLGYLDNFPNLLGSVHSYFGNEAKARQMAERARNGERWEDMLDITQTMLTPAVCYPLYPTFTGLLPTGGRLVTILGWAYRHEPSDEPTRLQSFRVREYIRAGKAAEVEAWRDAWLQRAMQLLEGLGLPVQSDVATDPFFGRVGKMIAANQLDQRLKFEVLVPVISQEKPTAICSFNWHQDYFSSKFGIQTSDAEVASTACLGFGMERVTLALIKTHGFDPKTWPEQVRKALWPQEY